MKILLQILIVTFWIFSNGYQSIVTSFMLNPARIDHLKSVEEVLDSETKIPLKSIFEEIHEDNPKYQKAVKDGRVVEHEFLYYGKEKKEVANIDYCEVNKDRIEYEGDGKSWRGYYLIPEVVYSTFNDLYVKPFHPFIEKLQEIMDRTFEAGMHQEWTRRFYTVHNAIKYDGNFKRPVRIEEKKNLDFEDIVPFCLILAFGFVSSLLSLVFEIFYCDFVSELSREYFERKFGRFFKRKRKVKKSKVKIIQVKPRRHQRQNQRYSV